MFLTINSNFKWILINWAFSFPSNYRLRESTLLTHHHVVEQWEWLTYATFLTLSQHNLILKWTSKLQKPAATPKSNSWAKHRVLPALMFSHSLLIFTATPPVLHLMHRTSSTLQLLPHHFYHSQHTTSWPLLSLLFFCF